MASETNRVSNRTGRPNYAAEFKRRLAAAACAPDISVSMLARQHGINTNMLFTWRRKYRAGQLGTTHSDQAILLPVTTRATTEPPATHSPATLPKDATTKIPSCIEIDMTGMTLRWHGAIDEAQLRLVLRCLLGKAA